MNYVLPEGYSMDEAVHLVANLINPQLQKKLTSKPKNISKVTNLYNDSLSHFTHRLNQRLWTHPLYKSIYMAFFNSGELAKFSDRDQTLSRSKSQYLEEVDRLLTI